MTSISELRRDLKKDIVNSKQQIEWREKDRGDNWNVMDSDFYDYIERFFEEESWDNGNWSNLKNGYRIVDELIEKPAPTVIDFMATTAAVSSLFYDLPQEHKIGIAVSRRDNRTPIEKVRDERLGITQVAGDLMNHSTWVEVERLLDGRKADLITECGLLGVTFLPFNANFYGIMARRAWTLLDPNGGRLIAQACIDPSKWIDELNNNNINAEWSLSTDKLYSTIRLQRTPDSPSKLPLLV